MSIRNVPSGFGTFLVRELQLIDGISSKTSTKHAKGDR